MYNLAVLMYVGQPRAIHAIAEVYYLCVDGTITAAGGLHPELRPEQAEAEDCKQLALHISEIIAELGAILSAPLKP